MTKEEEKAYFENVAKQEPLFPDTLDFYHIPEEVNLEIIEAMQSRLEEYYIESLGHLTTSEIK